LEANQDKINWHELSRNPNAIHLLEANQDKIDWRNLSMNPNTIHLLEANQDKIDWKCLSQNVSAIHLLEANPDKIDWKQLSRNPSAKHLLENNLDKINWSSLLLITEFYDLFKANVGNIDLDKLDWYEISWYSKRSSLNYCDTFVSLDNSYDLLRRTCRNRASRTFQ